MKSIIFINTQKSGSSREAIRGAEELGYYTILFTDRQTYLEKRTEFPDVHLMQLIDLNNIDELRLAIKGLIMKAFEISAIVSFTDPYCYTAALLADEFGVNRYSTKAIGRMENKILSRQAISNTPYAPKFLTLKEDSVLDKKEVEKYLPFIMKSPNSTGSKEVFKINSYNDFKRCRTELNKRYPGVPVLIEEFLDGPQYLVETVVINNKVQIIAVIEQDITFKTRFIVTGYKLLVNIPEKFYSKLKETVEFIIKAHAMENGTCHLELRYVKEMWKLIEINPRISGAGMNKFLEIGLGINLVKETLKFALGFNTDFSFKQKVNTYAHYVTVSEAGILEKVTGKHKALESVGVKYVYIKPRKGALLTPPVSMGHRYAYVIAIGENDEMAKENAENSAAHIKFWVTPPQRESELKARGEEGKDSQDSLHNTETI